MLNIRKFKIISSCLTLCAFGALGMTNAQNNNLKIQHNIKALDDPIDYGTEIDSEYLTTTLDSVDETETSIAITVSFAASQDYTKSYYVGYGTSAADFKPATFEYKIRTYRGTTVTRSVALERNNQNGFYDTLGEISDPTLSLRACMPINPGESLVGNSYRVYNIFSCVRGADGRYGLELDGENNPVHYYSITTKHSRYKEFAFSDFASISYTGCSTFNGYSSICFTTTSFGNELADTYQSISASIRRVYNDNVEDIEKGTSWIRTMLAFNVDSKFYAYYEGGDVVEYSTLNDRLDITKSGTSIVLLYKDFKTEGLVDFEFYNFYVYVDIYSTTTGKSVTSSNSVLRFGYKKVGVSEVVDEGGEVVIEQTKNPFFVNVDVTLLISTLTLLAAFVGGTVALFLYRKKKYANDEFKRVRPKEFFQTAAMGLVFLESFMIALESIIFRATVLNTSFDVYNTIDILIIVFSVASIILGGYWIKYFVTEIKNIKAKREIERLKLNQNTMDDGVLTMPDSK